ncbi:unnamed protein product [Scytosiphon promiscuus]
MRRFAEFHSNNVSCRPHDSPALLSFLWICTRRISPSFEIRWRHCEFGGLPWQTVGGRRLSEDLLNKRHLQFLTHPDVGKQRFEVQFIGNAIGIIMGSIVLCSFKKCTYMTAGFLYILGFIIDLASLGLLSVLLVEYNDDEDEFDDLSTGFIIFMLVPPALGALCFLLGSVFAFKASCAWEKSGAPGTLPV